MVKWLKKAFNKKSLKEDTMNIEQITEAINKLSPDDKEKLLQNLAEAAPPAESEAEPVQGEGEVVETVPPDTDADSESDLTGEQAERVEIPAEAEAEAPPIAEAVVEPVAQAPDMSGQIAQAVTVAMAPVLVKLQELETKLSEAGREPQPVTDPTKQEKLNKVAGIYGG